MIIEQGDSVRDDFLDVFGFTHSTLDLQSFRISAGLVMMEVKIVVGH
jgi:hypothetical protein